MGYVRIDTSEVHALAADIRTNADLVEARTGEVIAVTGHKVAADGAVLAPKDTGNLANSIGVDVHGLSFEAGPTAFYGGFVEEGTDGPYPIPNAFGWGITVMHPGNAPEPYMGPAFDRNLEPAVEVLAQLAERILD